MHDLLALGWTDDRAAALAALAPDLVPARVVVELRGQLQVDGGGSPFAALLGGSLRHRAGAAERPAIGDWVAIRQGRDRDGSAPTARAPSPDDGREAGLATITDVLPRRSALIRLAASGRPQVLAANVDLAVIVMGLDGDYNVRRLERYLALCAAAGVTPAVLLSKADLGGEVAARTAEVGRAAGNAEVVALDLRGGAGAEWLLPRLHPRSTAVLLGSSGAGKSTLTNSLMGGAVQRTGAVRSHDDRGVHTTTHRQLFALPGGALLIDTPGLRSLALGDDGGLGRAFDDIETLAAGCQFRDCRHTGEPGCAVAAALATGELAAARMASYLKLRGEQSGPRPDHGAPRRRRR